MGQLTEIVNYTKINGVSVAISESEDSVRTQLVDSQVSLVHVETEGKTIGTYYDEETSTLYVITYQRGIITLIEKLTGVGNSHEKNT